MDLGEQRRGFWHFVADDGGCAPHAQRLIRLTLFAQIDVSFYAWRFHSAETGMAANCLPKGAMPLPV